MTYETYNSFDNHLEVKAVFSDISKIFTKYDMKDYFSS